MLGIEYPKPLLHAHTLQRIFELRPAVATHAISSAVDRENAAEVAMMATKEEIKGGYQLLHKHSFSVM